MSGLGCLLSIVSLAGLLLIGGLSGCSGDSASARALPQGPPIRVAIEELEGSRLALPVEFEAVGELHLYSVSDEPVLIRALERSRAVLRVEGGKMLLDGEPLASAMFRLTSSRAPRLRLRLLDPAGEPTGEFRDYRGVIDVFFYGEQLRLINELNLEEYLAGVLGQEMGNESFPLEALKAQAIVARTFTLYNLKRDLDSYGVLAPDLAYKATMEFQSYGGMEKESEKILQAIRETAGQVLTFDGRLFQAYYHSTCGGATASGQFFGEQDIPPLGGVKCESCQESPLYAWEREFAREELERILSAWATAQGIPVHELVSVRPVEPLPSEHHSYLRVVHGGGAFEMRIDHFRKLIARHFASRHIPSSRFTVSPGGDDGSSLVFRGRGFGHGVGLCQYGAAGLARTATSGKILAHYFPEAGQKKLY